MTQLERDEIISRINRESASPEDKANRIKIVNQTFANAQNNAAEAARQKQQFADNQLKSRLKTAYMQNPAASDEDFERDYPTLKSDYLRGEAMKQDAEVQAGMRRRMLESI
jgi:hypothetical protein